MIIRAQILRTIFFRILIIKEKKILINEFNLFFLNFKILLNVLFFNF